MTDEVKTNPEKYPAAASMSNPSVNEPERVERAAFALQQAFLCFRKATWHIFIKKITVGKELINVSIDSTNAGRRNGWFAPFPNHLVPEPMVQNAVLTTMSCHELGHMKHLVEQVFKGMDVLIEEARVVPKDRGAPRTLLIAENGDIGYSHYGFWLMRVTSRETGRQWALDLCGAQYDVQIPCFAWDFACKHFFDEIIAIRPLGTLAEHIKKMIEVGGVSSLELEIGARAMEIFGRVVDAGMEKKGLTWSIILGRDKPDYLRHRSKIMKVGMRAMEAYVESENLTKRRQKAERYEKRHEEELDIDRKRWRELLK